MRSGACTLQQTLTVEAASVLKHSLGLARRRGHAQVTPLHVAATLLSLRASPLRRACLQSQQLQPQSLHCRALELCFNVALNRLPTTPGPLLHSQPSLSNALIAALKRAQAHQRRGCIEQQQQQPLLTIKVELDQLIISILDDPSVSRVMREAGFSSTLVKTNIEDSSSSLGASSVFQSYNSSGGGVFSSPCSPSPTDNHRETIINTNNNNTTTLRNSHFLVSYYGSEYASASPVLFSSQKKASSVYPIGDSSSCSKDGDGDIKVVMDVLMRKKKRNTVIVGDSVSVTEGLVGELMGKIERGDVPDELKSINFIKFQFSSVSLRLMKRDEVEMNLSVLKRKVESVVSEGGRGAIFYVGDLKWTVVDDDGGGELVSGYNPIQHLVVEMGKMFGEDGNCNNISNSKVWLMGTASYQTYIKCQMRQPSLETLWALQAVPVPSGGLGLTLHASSVYDSKMSMSQNPSHILDTRLLKEEHDKLNCCEECASNYDKEAQLFKPGGQKKLLPSWLQSSTEAHQKDELAQLKRKWNRLCHFLHQSKEPQNQNHLISTSQYTSNAKIYPYNSSYPWWPNQSNVFFPDSSSISFADSAAKPAADSSSLVPPLRRQQSCSIEFNFSEVTAQKKQGTAATTNLDCLKSMMEGNKEVKITLALGNSTFFGGSGQSVENITDTRMQRAHVCKMLQENVPWQSESLASIAEALVDPKPEKQTSTWFLLQGNDSVGKTRLALAIAESVFGSVESLLHLDMKKLENSATPFSEIVAGSLKRNEKIVVLVEDVDFAEPQFKKSLADEFEASKFGHLSIKDGNNDSSGQAIFILTTSGGTRSNEEQNNNNESSSVMRLVLKVSENKANFEKRRAELDLFGKIKIPRIEENEEEIMFVSEEWSNKKKDFSRQSSFNTLDLNLKANEEEEEEEYDDGENSPISSDLTGEPIADMMNSNGFLDSIENRFEFNTSPARDKEKEEMLFSKIKGSLEEVTCGKRQKKNVNFSVDERVIEEIGVGCGSFTNSMFEKWLKDIFQSSLLQQKVINKYGEGDGKEGIVFITLCWGGGKGQNRKMDSGFMGSCLPKNIQIVNYFME